MPSEREWVRSIIPKIQRTLVSISLPALTVQVSDGRQPQNFTART